MQREHQLPPSLPAKQYPAVNAPASVPYSSYPTNSGMAITSLILGIVGVSLLAVVFGHIARSQIAKSGGFLTGDGMAMAGLILGYLGMAVGLVISVIYLFIFVLAFGVAASGG